MFYRLTDRQTHRGYFHPKVKIKDYNVMIDGRSFFDQTIKNNSITYDTIQTISIAQGDIYTTGCLLDYTHFKENYNLIAIDVNKQRKLDADPNSIQQINFIGYLERGGNGQKFFIIEEVKETVLNFLIGTFKVLRFHFVLI